MSVAAASHSHPRERMTVSPCRFAVSLPALVLLVVGALLLPSRPAAAQKARDSVSLRFGWPVGMSARVDQRWSRVRRGQRADSSALRTTYRMRVLTHPEGRLVVSDSFAFPGAPAPVGDREAMAQRLLTQLGSLSPSYVVSAAGEFRQLVDAQKMKATVDSMLAPLLTRLEELPPQARAMLQSATSEQALAARAAEGWNALAGAWVGADFAVGDVYRSETNEPIPMLGGATVPMRYEFTAVERTSCGGGAASPERGCVRLRMTSRPDSAGMRKVLEGMLAQFGAKAAEAVKALRGMTVENEIVVVAEPATLVPHFMSQTKRVRVRTAATATEPAGATSQTDVRTAKFEYAKP